jgi:hypothetical protein
MKPVSLVISSSPTQLFQAKDDANAKEHMLACLCFLELMSRDSRVERAYQQWRDRPRDGTIGGIFQAGCEDLAHTVLPGLLKTIRFRTSPALSSAGKGGSTLAIGDALPWLALALYQSFVVRLGNELTPGAFGVAGAVTSPLSSQRKRGRQRQETISRNVEWLYRVHVHEPGESVRALARQYGLADGRQRSGDGRSVIQAAINRAKELLDFAHLPPLPK